MASADTRLSHVALSGAETCVTLHRPVQVADSSFADCSLYAIRGNTTNPPGHTAGDYTALMSGNTFDSASNGADESYGIEVARLAGVPEPVIETAKRVLEGLEQSRGGPPVRRPAPVQPAPQAPHPAAGEILSVLERTDVTVMTPMEAINLLYRLKKLAEREDGA